MPSKDGNLDIFVEMPFHILSAVYWKKVIANDDEIVGEFATCFLKETVPIFKIWQTFFLSKSA